MLLLTSKEKLLIWLAFAIFAIPSLFPPWVEVSPIYDYDGLRWGPQRISRWHAPLFKPPKSDSSRFSVVIDYPAMFTEIAVGEAFIVVLYLTSRKGKTRV